MAVIRVAWASPPAPTRDATLHLREEMSEAEEGEEMASTEPLIPEMNREVASVAGGYCELEGVEEGVAPFDWVEVVESERVGVIEENKVTKEEKVPGVDAVGPSVCVRDRVPSVVEDIDKDGPIIEGETDGEGEDDKGDPPEDMVPMSKQVGV